MSSSRVRAALLLGLIGLPPAASAQAPNTIQARDGDVIVVGSADRVRVIRRRDGQLRAVFDPVSRSLLLMLDAGTNGIPADGRVDRTYRFQGLSNEWPLGDRWQGAATVEEYSFAGETGQFGLGVITPAGLVQLLSRSSHPDFRNLAAAAVIDYAGETRTIASGLPFDVVERQQANLSSARPTAPPDVAPSYPTPNAPVRVGGAIKTPVKTYDVRPVYPQEALAARVTGVVVLETIIGVDGTVTNASVIRGVPLLNDAAQTAVRQWRFEPTLLNGVPVPVIMTVTVSFNLQ